MSEKLSREAYLLICLAEECAEVQKAISKALRFGLDHAPVGKITPNNELITQEMHDAMTVFKLLKAEGILPQGNYELDFTNKTDRLTKFMKYSRECGRLDNDPTT